MATSKLMQVINYGCDFNSHLTTKNVELEGKRIKADKFSTGALFFLRNTEADWWAPEVKVKSRI